MHTWISWLLIAAICVILFIVVPYIALWLFNRKKERLDDDTDIRVYKLEADKLHSMQQVLYKASLLERCIKEKEHVGTDHR